MSDEKALAVVEQKTVDFYGDDLTAAQMGDGAIYASLRHMCDALGIDRAGQVRRIKNHDVLTDGYIRGRLKSPPSTDGRGGGVQQAGLLRVDLVPLWLSGLTIGRIKEEMRPKLYRLQKEAAKVLWEAFQEGRLTADAGLDELLLGDTEAVQAYKLLQAMVKLARNQILIEAQIGRHSTKLADHEQRLEEIESTLGDSGRHVTPDQASQLSQSVKTVAMKLSKASGRNEYGGVYGELYRKFGITSYKQLPAAKFEKAMSWLNEWRESIEGDEPF